MIIKVNVIPLLLRDLIACFILQIVHIGSMHGGSQITTRTCAKENNHGMHKN